MPRVVVTSRLPVGESALWARAGTLDGINDELAPFLRMTAPPGWGGATMATVPVGVPLGRSRLLLFGVLPVDYDDVTLAEVQPGRRFLEVSTMGSMARWQHERRTLPVDGGVELRDALEFELRRPLALLPGAATVAAALVRRLFRHRHRRLAAHFARPVATG